MSLLDKFRPPKVVVVEPPDSHLPVPIEPARFMPVRRKRPSVKAFAREVIESMGGSQALAQLVARIARGEPHPVNGDIPSNKEQLAALDLMKKWGVGTETVKVEMTGKVQHEHLHGIVDLTKLTDGELDGVIKTLERVLVDKTVVEPAVIDIEPDDILPG